jgi:hypothetical protein
MGIIMGVSERLERVISNGQSLPDYQYGALGASEFRDVILGRGAIMLRNAADPKLLDKIRQQIDDIFEHYASERGLENETHPALNNSVDRADFWNQLKRSHIFDRTFKQFFDLSFYEIIRANGLWALAESAFPECEIREAADCNCRRTAVGDLAMFFDAPIDFHVDAQYHSIDHPAINFWTPLVACGKDAPGLKVVLLGVQETKDYLEFTEAGYEKDPDDIALMHHFRCKKESVESLGKHGLLKYVWAPQFEKGDILAFTNFTMHATHCLPTMTLPRTSVEVRVKLPAAHD